MIRRSHLPQDDLGPLSGAQGVVERPNRLQCAAPRQIFEQGEVKNESKGYLGQGGGR